MTLGSSPGAGADLQRPTDMVARDHFRPLVRMEVNWKEAAGAFAARKTAG